LGIILLMGEKLTVVVLDDEEDIIGFMEPFLRSVAPDAKLVLLLEGTQSTEEVVGLIRTACNTVLEEGGKALLLLDHNLIRVNSVEVVDGIQAEVKVLIMSGYGPGILRDYPPGRVGVLPKPFSRKTLVEVMDTAFSSADQAPKEAVPSPSPRLFENWDRAIKALETLRDPEERAKNGEEIILGVSLFCDQILSGQGDQTIERIRVHAVRGLLTAILGNIHVGRDIEQTLNRTLVYLRQEKIEVKTLAELMDLYHEFSDVSVHYEPVDLSIQGLNTGALSLFLSNIVANANAHPAIHDLYIRVEEGKNGMTFYIDDDGPPLPEGFFEANGEARPTVTGNGARDMLRIAEKEGWSIRAGSEGESKMVLTIPGSREEGFSLRRLMGKLWSTRPKQ
jgi:FixJ family two-component response regulator